MQPLEILWSFLAACLVLLVPGAALMAWLPGVTLLSSTSPGSRAFLLAARMVARAADAAGLSISLTALLGMLLFFAGGSLSGLGAAALYALCLLAILSAFVWGRFHLHAHAWKVWLIAGLLAVGLLASAVLWRFFQARALALPAWVDPVHHTLLVRKILEFRGLPPDYTPYIPAPFFYHYGFHLVAALFSFWSRLSPDQAVLWLGQAINALVAFSVFRAANALRCAKSACVQGEGQVERELVSPQLVPGLRAFMAALLVVFVFQMPAYYLTWGRFTMLSGLLLLGPLIAAAVEALDGQERAGARVRLAVLTAGLCLTHYFALIIAGLFLVVLGLSRLPRFFKNPLDRPTLIKLVAWTLLGVVLALPWILRVWYYNQQDAAVQVLSPFDMSEDARKNAANLLNYLVYLSGPKRNHILLGLAGVGLLAALRRSELRLVAAWALVILFFALPWGVRFDPFRPDHFAIVLFFPAAILLAELLLACTQALAKVVNPRLGRVILGLVLAGILAWGIRDTRRIINPVTVFADAADLSALNWISENTPPTARFYINSAPWVSSAYRGVDGGYWLTPYTGRGSLIPPIFYVWSSPEYHQQVTDWGERSAKITSCTPEFWEIVREAGLTHVYLHDGRGNLQPAALEPCHGLKRLYRKNGVVLYEILAP